MPAALAMRVAPWVGAILVAAALAQGLRDAGQIARTWAQMGPLPPGTERPVFAVTTLDGRPFTSADLEGRVTVVAFWATWCGVCRDELGDLDALAREYADTDVTVMVVNREGGGVSTGRSRAIAAAYLRERALSLPCAVDDGSMSRTFRVGPIPHSVVFDRRGTVAHVHLGRVTADTLRDEIEGLR